MLFLQGYLDLIQNRTKILSLLADKGFEVFALNFPGHGSSEQLPQMSWDILTDITISFCNEIHLESPLLFGYSMGGGIALKVAESGRMKLAGLRLLAPFCYTQTIDELNAAFGYMMEATKTIKKLIRNPQDYPFADSKILLPNLKAYVPIFLNFSLDLNKLDIPIRVMVFADDPVIPSTLVNSTLGSYPILKTFTLPDASHDLFFLSDQQLNAIITKLFD